jgi:hypothetical protein
MLDTRTPLISEFLKDHQQFSRLLYQIANLLQEGKIDLARERANDLDTVAGPHIAYEEAELYPRLAKLGETSVTEEMLVGQHHDALDAVRALIKTESPDKAALKSIQTGFQGALSHAEHCGSLISLLNRLDEQEQAESLKKLEGFRKQGKKWTELSA